MLKIKDNVDLKELEKYGFENITRESFIAKHYCYVSECGTNTFRILVKNNRTLSFNCPTNKVLNTLYDLIQAGLVEKAEE